MQVLSYFPQVKQAHCNSYVNLALFLIEVLNFAFSLSFASAPVSESACNHSSRLSWYDCSSPNSAELTPLDRSSKCQRTIDSAATFDNISGEPHLSLHQRVLCV